MKTRTILTTAACILLLPAASAIAQTPDGLPPALETVCDAETGAAFGWCNAYCEAMDCELANDGDPSTDPNASSTACNKVRTKFQQRTDRDMPCEVSCPCTEDPESFLVWNDYLTGTAVGELCVQDDLYCEFVEADPPGCTPPAGDITYISLTNSRLVFASSLGFTLSTPSGSQLYPPLCGENGGKILPVTDAQGVACKAELDAALAVDGLGCLDELP